MKKEILLFILISGVIAILFVYIIPHSNSTLKSAEEYNGIVIRKYYKRGNSIDVRLSSNEIYSTKVSISDSIFNSIEIGDLVIKKSGQDKMEVIKKEKY